MTPYFPDPDLESYRIAVEAQADDGTFGSFKNSGPDHAAVVLGNIYRKAQRSVSVFAGDFRGDISDKPYYLENLKIYLERNKPLTVIFEKQPVPASKAFQMMSQYQTTNPSINFYMLIGPIINPDRYKHFTLADGRYSRVEETDSFQAVYSFSDEETYKFFDKRFQRLLTVSSPVVPFNEQQQTVTVKDGTGEI
jgi:ABC-type transport system substrate-binding protein